MATRWQQLKQDLADSGMLPAAGKARCAVAAAAADAAVVSDTARREAAGIAQRCSEAQAAQQQKDAAARGSAQAAAAQLLDAVLHGQQQLSINPDGTISSLQQQPDQNMAASTAGSSFVHIRQLDGGCSQQLRDATSPDTSRPSRPSLSKPQQHTQPPGSSSMQRSGAKLLAPQAARVRQAQHAGILTAQGPLARQPLQQPQEQVIAAVQQPVSRQSSWSSSNSSSRSSTSGYAASWGSNSCVSSSSAGSGKPSARALASSGLPSKRLANSSIAAYPGEAAAALAAAAGTAVNRELALQHELQQDLAAVRCRKLIRRWQHAAADVALDKARARPMARLLGKRKAMRAWRAAMVQASSRRNASDTAICSDEPAPGGGSACSNQHQLQQQQQEQQQDMSRAERVAQQFNRLHLLHGCFNSWQSYAAAAAIIRAQQQVQLQAAQRRELAIQEQQEAVQHTERAQQQRQQALLLKLHTQQEQRRLGVASRFHQLYVLHAAVSKWKRAAAMSAALGRLHPAGMTVSVAANYWQPGATAGGIGELPGEVVQQKTQQLLERLARRQQQQQQACSGSSGSAGPSSTAPEQHRDAAAAAAAVAGPAQQPGQQLHSSEPSPEPVTALQAVANAVCTAQQADEDADALLQCLAALGQELSDTADAMHCNLALSAGSPVGTRADTQDGAMAAPSDMPLAVAAVAGPGPDERDRDVTGLSGQAADQPAASLVEQPASVLQHPEDGQQMQLLPAAEEQALPEQRPQQQGEQQCKEQCEEQQQGEQQQGEQQQGEQQQQLQPAAVRPLPVDKQRQRCQLQQLLAAEQRRQRQEQQEEQRLRLHIAAQQAAMAEMHCRLQLALRWGLRPWLAFTRQRQQQAAAAAEMRVAALTKQAITCWKQALYERRWCRTCCHVQAFGRLRQLGQQHQQLCALAALRAWALAGRRYRQQLKRCCAAWRAGAAETRQLLHAAGIRQQAAMQRRVLRAWQVHTADQAHEQLLLELQLQEVAAAWRQRWQRQRILAAWHQHTLTAERERLQAARRQQTWGKVRGWLAEVQGQRGSCSGNSSASSMRRAARRSSTTRGSSASGGGSGAWLAGSTGGRGDGAQRLSHAAAACEAAVQGCDDLLDESLLRVDVDDHCSAYDDELFETYSPGSDDGAV